VKNVTMTVPDDVYRRARIRAAATGVSLSALVTDYLRSLASGPAEFARLEALQRDITDSIVGFSAGDRISRDEVHERTVR